MNPKRNVNNSMSHSNDLLWAPPNRKFTSKNDRKIPKAGFRPGTKFLYNFVIFEWLSLGPPNQKFNSKIDRKLNFLGLPPRPNLYPQNQPKTLTLVQQHEFPAATERTQKLTTLHACAEKCLPSCHRTQPNPYDPLCLCRKLRSQLPQNAAKCLRPSTPVQKKKKLPRCHRTQPNAYALHACAETSFPRRHRK